ncbi:alpha/beta hydrolase [Tessaracoccus antarcticus]|uniref:Esterase n=1 Tax=Tessaracoccus antarcticus TaxID=2479848 RepID=A0A3M0GAC5_9ACTN|nr:alpha/beta hydrolase-fold protein [Tessaracoccus antarcticus]RMB61965.1 hypothetical protein EAX62_05090 [Tessaracoccus antarcticus]
MRALTPLELPRPVLDAAAGQSPLTQWWVPAVAVVVALILTAVVVRRWLLHHGAPWRRVPEVALAMLAWAVAAALGVNSWYSIVPDLSALQREVESGLGLPVSYRTADGAHVKEHLLPASSTLGMPESSVWVYTPPGYDPAGGVRYPVVYLIHGDPGTSTNWFTVGRADQVVDAMIRAHVIPKVIVVSPDVNGGGVHDRECLNSRNGGPQIESWLYDELVPWVDTSFRTQADAQHRILGGMSSGGYCALDQGLRHLDVWGGIVALEAYGDPGLGAATTMGYHLADFERVSPTHYIARMEFPRKVPIFLDVGQLSDPNRVEALVTALRARGQDPTFQVEAGQGHTWQMARVGMPYGLDDVAAGLGWR